MGIPHLTMPEIETALLLQIAVYWPAVAYNSYGRLTHGSPEEIPVSWTGHNAEDLGRSRRGDTAMGFQATVTTDRRLILGSLLWLGTLATYLEETTGGKTFGTGHGTGGVEGLGIMMVRSASISAFDVKGRNALYTAGLMRYKGSLVP